MGPRYGLADALHYSFKVASYCQELLENTATFCRLGLLFCRGILRRFGDLSDGGEGNNV